MTCASAAPSRARSSSRCSSSQANSAASQMSPYLITSASPARSSRSGSVASVAVSLTTSTGWWKAPIRFLPPGWLTPRSEEHTSELQSRVELVCRLLLEKKKDDSQVLGEQAAQGLA